VSALAHPRLPAEEGDSADCGAIESTIQIGKQSADYADYADFFLIMLSSRAGNLQLDDTFLFTLEMTSEIQRLAPVR
jgi:hypothetical protein